jgi:tRNA A-37 threonylcarbamoyl transferase component Bud32
MEFENEIEVLESALSSLNEAIESIIDAPYHSYMASGWESDAEEIQNRLDELYGLQNMQWEQETKHQHYEYESGVL